MIKWLILSLIPLFLMGGGFLYLKFNDSQVDDSVTALTTEVPFRNILGVTSVTDNVDEVVKDSKSSLKDKVQDTADNLSSLIDKTTNQIIEKIFGKEEKVEEKTTENLAETSTSLKIDFKNHGTQKISLKKGVKYNLKFENIPESFCVFVKNQKIKLDSSFTTEVKLDNSGNYPISTDLCDSDQKNLGEFLVE